MAIVATPYLDKEQQSRVHRAFESIRKERKKLTEMSGERLKQAEAIQAMLDREKAGKATDGV